MTVVTSGLDSAKSLTKDWKFWICRVWLPLGLFIQLSGFFWLPNTHLYKVIVTNSLLLAALFSVFDHSAWRAALRSKLYPLILLYLFYMSIIPFVRQNEDPLACAHWSFYIALYIFAIGQRMRLTFVQMRYLFFLSSAICAAAIIYGIVYDVFYQHAWSDLYRLVGYGALYNPLRSGHLFGFFYIVALWLAMSGKGPVSRLWANCFIALTCLLGTVFTGSRAPLFGVAIAGFYLISLAAPVKLRKKSLVISSAILIGLWILFWQRLSERGLSLRPQVWSEVIKQWQLYPWFGAGYNASLNIKLNFIDHDFFDTHNIELAALYYGGIVGILLFCVVHAVAFFQAFCLRKSSSGAVLAGALMIYGMITLQFDGGSIIGRPNEFWLLLWFPIALLLFIKRNSALPQNTQWHEH